MSCKTAIKSCRVQCMPLPGETQYHLDVCHATNFLQIEIYCPHKKLHVGNYLRIENLSLDSLYYMSLIFSYHTLQKIHFSSIDFTFL